VILWLLGIAATLMILLFAYLAYWRHTRGIEAEQKVRPAANKVGKFAQAALLYSNDFDDRVPIAPFWIKAIPPYSDEVLDRQILMKREYDGVPSETTSWVSMNIAASSQQISAVARPDKTVLFFVSLDEKLPFGTRWELDFIWGAQGAFGFFDGRGDHRWLKDGGEPEDWILDLDTSEVAPMSSKIRTGMTAREAYKAIQPR
jgi:hypothetical protein